MLTAVTGTVFAAAPGSGRFAEARGVLNRAEPFDTDAGAGAVAKQCFLAAREAHAFRGAGGNNIAWIERVEGGTEGDELGHGEDEVIGVIVLADFTIDGRD